MADLKAEQIMDAVHTLITGLATTGGNVTRGPVYPFSDAELPGLALFMGVDTPINYLQSGKIDWQLSVQIESRVKQSGTQIDQTLNQIRKEVHLAMAADYTLGGLAIDVKPGSAAQPSLSGEGEKPMASQLLEYLIVYRTSETDLSM